MNKNETQTVRLRDRETVREDKNPAAPSRALLVLLTALTLSWSCLGQAQYGQVTISYNSNTNAVQNTNELLLYGVNPSNIGSNSNGQTNAYTVFPLTNNQVGATSNLLLQSNPINLTRFDEFVLVFQYQVTNAASQSSGCTNTVQFLQSADGTNWATVQTNWLSFSLSPPTGQTNAILVTNVTRTLWGSQGYLQLYSITGGPAGCTNTSTNVNLQIWVKPRRTG